MRLEISSLSARRFPVFVTGFGGKLAGTGVAEGAVGATPAFPSLAAIAFARAIKSSL